MLRTLGLERFNQSKLKPHLKMAEQRFGILNSKKTNLIKQQKREIAELLRTGKEEKARIRVEHLIRSDFTIEAYELLALLCELLYERVALIAHEKECPGDMKEAMCTLIWAARRTEVPELAEVAKQLELKYGKEFVDEARDDSKECVNTRVAHKLSVAPPSAFLVMKYLTAIADEYNVDWTPAETGLDQGALATQAMPGPTGFSVNVAPGSNLTQAYSETKNEPPVAHVVGVQPEGTVLSTLAPTAPPIVQPNSNSHSQPPPQDIQQGSLAPKDDPVGPTNYHDFIPAAPGYDNIPPPSSSSSSSQHQLPPGKIDDVPPPSSAGGGGGPPSDGNPFLDNNTQSGPPQQPPPVEDFFAPPHNSDGPPPSDTTGDFDALAKRFESLKK